MPKSRRIVFSALFIALGIVLPLAFHSIPNAGRIFLPMHIPVLLCGIVCGFPYGLLCGVITPLLSSLLTGMPPAAMLPSMLCELAAYGAVSSLIIQNVRFKNVYVNIYVSLLCAMLAGRVFYGVMNAFVFSAGGYSMQIWLGAAFITALPGILIQIVIIPIIVAALRKVRLTEARQN